MINRWKQEMARIKREKGVAITNFTMSSVEEEKCDYIYSADTYYATLYWDIDKYELNFVVASLEDLHNLIETIQGNTVIPILYKEDCELKSFFTSIGVELYATYQRTTICYKSNPYLIPEKSKRRQLLPKMYDPKCGEFPHEKDAEEIDRLCRKVFDPLCDDMFTIEEWKEKIRSKNVLVYKDDGEITALYVWCLEGKKLYSNMSVNIGAANTLYNMERRVFEEMWNKGIRVFYGWGNLENMKAKTHAMSEFAVEKCAKSINRLFCDIYYKSDGGKK